MATIDQIFLNIQNAIVTFGQNNFINPQNIVTTLGTGIAQLTLGVVITVMAAMLKEVLRPVETGLNAIGTNIQGQTTSLVAKADEAISQRSKLPKIKPDAPEPFDGKPDHVMSFLAVLTVYFTALKETDNKNMILFALSGIKGGKENMAS